MNQLEQNWLALGESLGVPTAVLLPEFDHICTVYGENGRYYHNLTHIAQVLAVVQELGGNTAVQLATWYHDIVYNTQAQDNEAQSATYARQTLTKWGLSPMLINQVEQLILATQTHIGAENDPATAILLDADLAILGAEPAIYAQYAQAIRQEYSWVPDEIYKPGRGQILHRFLAERIYFTEKIYGRCEHQARHNLNQELTQLGTAPHNKERGFNNSRI